MSLPNPLMSPHAHSEQGCLPSDFHGMSVSPQKDCVSSDHAGPVLSPHSPSEQGWVPSCSLRRSDVPSDAFRHLTKVCVTSCERFCLLRPCRAGIVPSLPLRSDIHKRSISPQLPSGKDSVSVAHTVQLSFPQSSSEPLRMSNVSSHAFRAELYSPQIPGGPCSLRCPHNRACSPQTLSAHPLRGELCPLRHPQKVHVPSCANREGLGLLSARSRSRHFPHPQQGWVPLDPHGR